MTDTTANEDLLLLAIANEDRDSDDLTWPVWSAQLIVDLPRTSIPGVMSSLSRKKLVWCSGGPKEEATVELTSTGVARVGVLRSQQEGRVEPSVLAEFEAWLLREPEPEPMNMPPAEAATTTGAGSTTTDGTTGSSGDSSTTGEEDLEPTDWTVAEPSMPIDAGPRDQVRAMLAEARSWPWLELWPQATDEDVLGRLAKMAGALLLANKNSKRRGKQRDVAHRVLGWWRYHCADAAVDALAAGHISEGQAVAMLGRDRVDVRQAVIDRVDVRQAVIDRTVTALELNDDHWRFLASRSPGSWPAEAVRVWAELEELGAIRSCPDPQRTRLGDDLLALRASFLSGVDPLAGVELSEGWTECTHTATGERVCKHADGRVSWLKDGCIASCAISGEPCETPADVACWLLATRPEWAKDAERNRLVLAAKAATPPASLGPPPSQLRAALAYLLRGGDDRRPGDRDPRPAAATASHGQRAAFDFLAQLLFVEKNGDTDYRLSLCLPALFDSVIAALRSIERGEDPLLGLTGELRDLGLASVHDNAAGIAAAAPDWAWALTPRGTALLEALGQGADQEGGR